MNEWGNSLRVKTSELGVIPHTDERGLLSFVKDEQKYWDLLVKDAQRRVIMSKIKDPDVFLWFRDEKGGEERVMGWYIGDNETLTKRSKEEGLVVVGVLRVKTAEHVKVEGSIFDKIREKFFGIKKDPKQMNPYH